MAARKIKTTDKAEKRIFISWSGSNTKEFAIQLKKIIEQTIFPDTGLKCFVSDVDIDAGTDWWTRIKDELTSCGHGILCVTKENIGAPWIFYEAGGMAAQDIPSIPLLVNCDINLLSGTPLQGKQCISFDDQPKFIQMMEEINNKLNLLPNAIVKQVANIGYQELKEAVEPIISRLNNINVISVRNIYPQEITTVKTYTVYISVPMASISEEEYINLHNYLLELQIILKEIGFVGIFSSALTIEDRASFDGGIKAIEDNFSILKEVDSLLVIYPKRSPSSTLVDIGYGIALSKKMVIFYGEDLPYMLEEAGQYIKHVKTYHFNKLEDIGERIRRNGMALFEGE